MNNEWIEISAKTVEEAINEALIALQTVMSKMEYEVIDKGSNGFLGIFGKHEAKIRARLKTESPAEKPQVKKSVVEKPFHKENGKQGAGKRTEEGFHEKKAEKKILEKAEQNTIKERKAEEEIVRKPVSPEILQKAKDRAFEFLADLCKAMKLETVVDITFDEAENELVIDVKSDDMGILIGKRGQTLDSLQYIVSLVINKDLEEYVKIKLDSENYRVRRKETLENLAKNIASKVKRTGRQVSLEPMNSFERRIIHAALQADDEVETYSEGNDPYRKVVVKLKGEKRNYGGRYNRSYNGKKPYGKKPYGRNGGYSKGYHKNEKFTGEDKSEEGSI